MTSNDDELDLFEARKAAQASRFARAETDASAAYARREADQVRSIVQANGFVDKFREMIYPGAGRP